MRGLRLVEPEDEIRRNPKNGDKRKSGNGTIKISGNDVWSKRGWNRKG